MKTIQSKDGTCIAFDRTGSGPPIILVLGAFNERATGEPLAEALAPNFTVFNYDRRGRGASGDTAPYAVQREIEDLDALVREAGGSARVFGYSSGAMLALKAAAHGVAIEALALYEPPFIVDGARPTPPTDLVARLTELIASGRRGDAVELFQTKAVGIPSEIVAQLRRAPFWPGLEAIAHTLVYEAEIFGDCSLPAGLRSSVRIPALVLAGGESPGWMATGARALADALTQGSCRVLEGESHDISPDVTAAALREFFAGAPVRTA